MAIENDEADEVIKKESRFVRFFCVVIGLLFFIGPFSPIVYEHQWKEILSLNLFGQLLLLIFAVCAMSLGVIFLIVAYKGYLPTIIAKHIG